MSETDRGRLVHEPTGRILAPCAAVARTPWRRLVGWIGRPVPQGEALAITACRQIHTFGVRTPLDVAYCGADGHALRVEEIAPNRIGPRVEGAERVWETASGGLVPYVRPGDRLLLVPLTGGAER